MSGAAGEFAGLWPYALVVLVGFLPSEIWRAGSALLAGWIDATSEIFTWIRLVATTLVTAVVIKLVMQPPPALAVVPLWARLGALALGAVAFQAAGRRMPAGIATGMAAILAAATLLAE
ncbi:AzlD domain-containing protein [Pseudochelatococcus sp. B33]